MIQKDTTTCPSDIQSVMETKKATSVTQVYPTSNRDKTIYAVSHYEVGKKAPVPGYGLEEVLEIRVTTEFGPHIEVTFKDFGDIWILEWITEIRFENANYREIFNARRAVKEDENGSGQSPSVDQDSQQNG